MTDQRPNIVLGAVLLALSAVWTWLVVDTIPSGFGDGGIGPRAFPLVFGLALAALSIVLMLLGLVRKEPGAASADRQASGEPRFHWASVALLLVEISLYGFLLEKCGFLIATAVIVLVVMLVNLRVRSVKTVLGMTLGTTLGCWIIFEKFLGIYLATGTWIDLG